MEELHFREQIAEMLGVVSALAMPRISHISRPLERRFTQHIVDPRRPARCQIGQRWGNSGASHLLVNLIGSEELRCEAPELVQGVLDTPTTLFRAIPKTDEP